MAQEVLPQDAADKVTLPSAETTSMLSIIERVVSDPAIDTNKIQALLDMQRQLMRDQAERELNTALSEVIIPVVKKNGKIPLKDSGGLIRELAFAKWPDIYKALMPILRGKNLSLSFTAPARKNDGGGAEMTGRLSHKDGAFRESQISLPLDTGPGRNNLQAMGSTISYGKKYLTFMLLNIATEDEDDDGNTAEPITTEQAAELHQRLLDTKSDIKKFCKLFGVDDVRKIQQRDHKKALALIAAKNAEKKVEAQK